jgi:hypothetical protein
LNQKDPVWQMNMCHRQFPRGASLRSAQRDPTMCVILSSYSIQINMLLLTRVGILLHKIVPPRRLCEELTPPVVQAIRLPAVAL